MSDLKLGPLPKSTRTRMSLALPATLKEELESYAVEYGRLHGPVDCETLIPHMLEAFLRSDREWRRRKHASTSRAQRQSKLDSSVRADVPSFPNDSES
ncbi:DUF2274 domain-containing protein [Methylobacterium aquaticum]|uniref:DUF2274 domain-containing protein n=1 Tax=Methylobacterium aquaticum TaxID=270351 RepID=UPI003D184895